MTVHNVDLIMSFLQKADCVSKYVVMEKGIHHNVMTEIMWMVMDAAEIVICKSVSHAMVVLPAAEILVVQYCPLRSLSNHEDSQDYMERSFLMSD